MSIKTTIEYNGNIIVPEYEEDLSSQSVIYNNQTIMTLNAGDTKYLNTKDTVCEDNIKIGKKTLATKDTKLVDYVKISVESVPLPIGGRIFYDNGDNGAAYTFYDASGNVITDQTISGLANAVTYTMSGTTSKDRWYVYDNTTHATGGKTANGGLVEYIYWGYQDITTGATANTIGSGKTNTATVLSITDTSSYSDSIFKYIKACNDANLNGCNNWFIGSNAEHDQLRSSGLVNWYSDKNIWSSVEISNTHAYYWKYYNSSWDNYWAKGSQYYAVAFRAF